MNNLLEQYSQELQEAKQTQKELIKKGKFGAPLQLINAKIDMLTKFVNDLKNHL
jgi:hypothetical protein